MLLLIEYNIQMMKQAQHRTATETTIFILVFSYNGQFYLKSLLKKHTFLT